jgi:uncharacterized phage protein (TIGR01671 family)
MSRELKFRVWDHLLRQMIPHEDLIKPQRGGFLTLAEFLEFPQNHCTIMQFTGLYDKKGIPIYEGDVIDMTYDTDPADDHKYEEVTYFEGCFFVGDVWLSEDYEEVRGVAGNKYEQWILAL